MKYVLKYCAVALCMALIGSQAVAQEVPETAALTEEYVVEETTPEVSAETTNKSDAEVVYVEENVPSQETPGYMFKPYWGIGLQYGMTFTEMESWNRHLMTPNGLEYSSKFAGEHELYVEWMPVEGFRISAFGGWTSIYSSNPSYDYFYGGLEPTFSVRRRFYELAAGLGVGYGQYIIGKNDSTRTGHGLLLRPFIEGRVYPCDFMAIYVRLGISVMKSMGIEDLTLDPRWNGTYNTLTASEINETRLYHMGPHIALGLRFGFYPNPIVNDSDGDGVFDDTDACPETPGDAAYYGCENPDTDNDGICDPWVSERELESTFEEICFGNDKCQGQTEDADEFDDEDGCPDPDNDGDGFCDPWVSQTGAQDVYASICKASDTCSDDSEDFDGFDDEDGCPDPDNDGDGICDPWVSETDSLEDYSGVCERLDVCALVAGPDTQDGCPDPDSDQDNYCEAWVYDHKLQALFPKCQGIDQCPQEKGEDARGCVYRRVQVTADKIQINEAINFALNKATIQADSDSLLEEIAKTFNENPQIKKVEIQGHTDLSGKAKKNQKLSEERAKSVYNRLIKLGVEKDRLTYKGYGMTQPVEPLAEGQKKETAEQAAKNRRVVFLILEQDAVQKTVLVEK